MKKEKTVFSARLTFDELEWYNREAERRGMSKTGLLRYWIRAAAGRNKEAQR